MVRLAIAQTAAEETLDANLATAERFIADAGAHGAGLICFPEIHLSPFFPKTRGGKADAWAMRPDHLAFTRLGAAAKAAGIVVIANVYLEIDNKRYDASPVFDADGRLLGTQLMNEIAQFEGFWEQDYYAAGDGFQVFDTQAGRIGVVICYDRHFPESYRAAAKAGAQIIATPTCCETGEPLELFEAEMRTLAFHNCVYALLANRCGEEAPKSYAGRSLITGPDGAVLGRAGGEPQLLFADADLGARDALAKERGFLDSRLAQQGARITTG